MTTSNVPDIEYITDRLATLLRIPSPSGDTKEAIDWIKAEFEALGYKPAVNNKGGLLVTIPGVKEGNERGLSAHVDTLGAMVFEIKSNGRLKLTLVGGSPWPSLEGEHVTIKASNGKRYTGQPYHCGGSRMGPETTKLERNADNMEVRIKSQEQGRRTAARYQSRGLRRVRSQDSGDVVRIHKVETPG